MAFEKTILNRVAKVLKSSNQASFTCGCLFVDCDESESNKILRALRKEVSCDVIKSGPIQGEYAYDFV